MKKTLGPRGTWAEAQKAPGEEARAEKGPRQEYMRAAQEYMRAARCVQRKTICVRRKIICVQQKKIRVQRKRACVRRKRICLQRRSIRVQRQSICVQRKRICVQRQAGPGGPGPGALGQRAQETGGPRKAHPEAQRHVSEGTCTQKGSPRGAGPCPQALGPSGPGCPNRRR